MCVGCTNGAAVVGRCRSPKLEGAPPRGGRCRKAGWFYLVLAALVHAFCWARRRPPWISRDLSAAWGHIAGSTRERAGSSTDLRRAHNPWILGDRNQARYTLVGTSYFHRKKSCGVRSTFPRRVPSLPYTIAAMSTRTPPRALFACGVWQILAILALGVGGPSVSLLHKNRTFDGLT